MGGESEDQTETNLTLKEFRFFPHSRRRCRVKKEAINFKARRIKQSHHH